MINIEHLDKTYHLKNADVHAVDAVSLHIESGQIYGVIGYSGAGKSTLLRIIMGIFDANIGSVTIDGEEVSHNVKLKQKMVFIPDDLFFYPGYTLIDMAKYYQSMYDEFDMDYLRELAKL